MDQLDISCATEERMSPTCLRPAALHGSRGGVSNTEQQNRFTSKRKPEFTSGLKILAETAYQKILRRSFLYDR